MSFLEMAEARYSVRDYTDKYLRPLMLHPLRQISSLPVWSLYRKRRD